MNNENERLYRGKLKCWLCGNTIDIMTPGIPTLAIDLVMWAHDVGWFGIIDIEHHRSLVFCSDKCVKAAQTKKGTIRVRPPKSVVKDSLVI